MGEKKGVKAIGFAVGDEAGVQLAPTVFFDEDVEWVSTIYPKHGEESVCLTKALLQLSNYVSFYQNEHLLVIGGNQSAVMGICQGLNNSASLLWFTESCMLEVNHNDVSLIDEISEPRQFGSYKPGVEVSTTIIGRAQIAEFSPQVWYKERQHQDIVLCADLTHFNESLAKIVSQCIKLSPKILVLTGYSPYNDDKKETYNEIKLLIHSFCE